MSKKLLPIVIIPFIFLLFLGFFLFSKPPQTAFSSTIHVVISEVQIYGTTATDEFIELYNPTSEDIVIDGWRLTKKTKSGNQSNLVSNLSGTIPAYGFFLIAHPDSSYIASADIPYSAASNNISNDNTVTLYSDAGTTEVDVVGLGEATVFETTAFENPPQGQSIERKPGASEPLAGNSVDTDNNASDFDLRDVSEPQNSTSPTEQPSQPSPTPTVSPTAEPTATPTPSPTSSPSPTPTISPTPTPSPEPSSSPTPTPEPSVTPSPSPAPPLLRPTLIERMQKHFDKLFTRHAISCTIEYREKNVIGRIIQIPRVSCHRPISTQ